MSDNAAMLLTQAVAPLMNPAMRHSRALSEMAVIFPALQVKLPQLVADAPESGSEVRECLLFIAAELRKVADGLEETAGLIQVK